MAKVTPGTARAAAIIGFVILLCGIAVTTCGVIWVIYGGYQGHGLWSGIPMLAVAALGFISLSRNNLAFTFYVVLCVLTCIASGIQAVAAGLELEHWSQFIGERKCSVIQGFCRCITTESIRISDLDSCDKIPSINHIFITLIFFCIIGSFLCLIGAIAGCVGLATVPRSSPSTLQRPRKNKPAVEVTYKQNNYQNRPEPDDDIIGKDRYDSGSYERDNYGDRVREIDNEDAPFDRDYRYYDYKRAEIERSDRERGSDYYRDNISDRGSYDRNYPDRNDLDREYDRYSDRYDDRDYYTREYDYDRSYEDRRTPPPDDKTYL